MCTTSPIDVNESWDLFVIVNTLSAVNAYMDMIKPFCKPVLFFFLSKLCGCDHAKSKTHNGNVFTTKDNMYSCH